MKFYAHYQGGQIITRIAKGRQSGAKWDRVRLENGMTGFVSSDYLQIYQEKPQKDDYITLSSGLKLNTNNAVNTYGGEITGLQNNPVNVKVFLQNVASTSSNYTVQVESKEKKRLTENDLVGTGCKLKVYLSGNFLREYTIILYGDVNGDGKINSIDLLVLQRHILNLKLLDDISSKAGNVDNIGDKPSSADLLKIQRDILNLEKIKQ